MEQSKAVVVAQSNSLVHYQETMGLAEVFVKSGMFEDVKDVAQAAVKIMRGQELGFPPVTSMEVIDIVQKRLFLKPRAVGALINSCGYGSFEPLERTAERCVIQFRRRYRDGWRDLPPVEYTIEIAKARGLVNRTPEWKTDPANMLFWRCLGRGGAQYFPELLSGLQVAMDDEPVTDERAGQNIADLFGGENAKPTHEDGPTIDAEGKQDSEDVPEPEPLKNDSGAFFFGDFVGKVAHHCQNYDFDATRVLALACLRYKHDHPNSLSTGQERVVLSWLTSEGGRKQLERSLREESAAIDGFLSGKGGDKADTTDDVPDPDLPFGAAESVEA